MYFATYRHRSGRCGDYGTGRVQVPGRAADFGGIDARGEFGRSAGEDEGEICGEIGLTHFLATKYLFGVKKKWREGEKIT